MSITARKYEALLIENTGKFWGWGEAPRLVGVAISSAPPFQIPNATAFTQLSTGEQNHLAEDSSGNLWTWGINVSGSTGISVFNNNYSYTWKIVAAPQ